MRHHFTPWHNVVNSTKPRNQSFERALRILACFGKAQKTMTLAELTKAVQLPKFTVLRLCTTLEGHNFLILDNNQVLMAYRSDEETDRLLGKYPPAAITRKSMTDTEEIKEGRSTERHLKMPDFVFIEIQTDSKQPDGKER